MRSYGLIGQSLSHSFSQRYFTKKFVQEQYLDCTYDLYELPNLENFKDFLKEHPNLLGLNVTIPYKKQILSLLDYVDKEAKEIGSVNTIRILRTGEDFQTMGFNTDIEGFRQSIDFHTLPNKALILGTGGAAVAVAHVLQQWSISFRFVSRNPQPGMFGYEQLSEQVLCDYPWIINCTPAGMYPNIAYKPPLPYAVLTEHNFLYDLIYNPEETLFLKEGRLRKARTQNGLKMLVLQAEASWKIWNEAKRTEYL